MSPLARRGSPIAFTVLYGVALSTSDAIPSPVSSSSDLWNSIRAW